MRCVSLAYHERTLGVLTQWLIPFLSGIAAGYIYIYTAKPGRQPVHSSDWWLFANWNVAENFVDRHSLRR